MSQPEEERPEEERRHSPRIEKVNLVHISRFDEDGFRADLATGRTLNISEGGMRLELHHAVPLRSQVKLSVVIENGIYDVEGKVVYLESLDDVRCVMGIEFEGLDAETRQAFADFVAEHG